jgi:hypothetical protein
MTKEELALLGFTEEDVLNRLVDKLCEQMVETEECYAGDFGRRLQKAVEQRVSETLDKAMAAHILPKVSEMVEGVCLVETNRWGEKVGEKLTFIEYLVKRTEAYITEGVNYNGKTQSEDSYSWRKHSTRIAFMINQHLQYSIDNAMKKALGDVNSSIRKGLENAVKIALQNITVQVKTDVITQ